MLPPWMIEKLERERRERQEREERRPRQQVELPQPEDAPAHPQPPPTTRREEIIQVL